VISLLAVCNRIKGLVVVTKRVARPSCGNGSEEKEPHQPQMGTSHMLAQIGLGIDKTTWLHGQKYVVKLSEALGWSITPPARVGVLA
jgi:hypothetical protein